MTSIYLSWLRRILHVSALLFAVTPGRAVADLADKPFPLRLFLSLERSSNYSDAAARQASIAFPGGSSDNPAADDWQPHRGEYPTVSLTNIHTVSKSGARVVATAGTVNFSIPESGAFSMAYARTDTNTGENRQGLTSDLSSNEFFVAYSRRLSGKASFGGELRIADIVIKEQFFEVAAGGLPFESEIKGRAVDLSVGLLVQPEPGWFAGAAASVGAISAKTEIRNLVPVPTSSIGRLPSGTMLDRIDDEILSLGIRTGVGYVPSPSYGLYLDGQYLILKADRAGSAEVGRAMAGVDLRIANSVVLRTGVGIDTEKETTLSIGASYRVFRKISLDVAYQHNAQPELRREFGRVDLLSASLRYPF